MRTIQQFSTYLPMHDGALLAVEVYMPPGPGPFSTVLSPTRYYRALESSTWPGRQLAALLSKTRRTGARFVNAGYVWLDIDVRGSGASSGVRHCPWSPTEIDDLVTVLDWIAEQPWSNGRVGATGISYVGTACEMLATRGHPALQAIAPRFGLFDVYTDVLAPGGIPLRWFLASWRQVNDAFDRGDFHDVLAPALRFVVEALAEGAHDHRTPSWTALLASIDPDALQRRLARMVKPMRIGVRRVERARAALAMAIDEHKHNYNVEAQALRLIFRDARVEETDIYDSHPFWTGSEGTADRFSPHNYQEALRSAGVPCYSQSGWGDGAYAGAAIKRVLNVPHPGNQLVLGPWEHGGTLQISPHAPHTKAAFDHETDLLAFFDHHLRDAPPPSAAPVRYYVMGAETWASANTWPPPSTPTPFYLGEHGTLRRTPPDQPQAVDAHRLPPHSTTGCASRWRSFIGPHGFIGYPRRRAQTRDLPSYLSAPLRHDTEITGHPIVHLHLRTAAEDGDLFVYLDEVCPDGSVIYITEGMLRLAHRILSDETPPYHSPEPYRTFRRRDARPMEHGSIELARFALLPVSYMARRGSSLRLTFAGADRDNFGTPLALGSVELHRSTTHASYVELPLVNNP